MQGHSEAIEQTDGTSFQVFNYLATGLIDNLKVTDNLIKIT